MFPVLLNILEVEDVVSAVSCYVIIALSADQGTRASFFSNVLSDSVKKELFQRSFSNKSFPRFLPDTMAVEKRLAYSIVQFLRDQTHCGSLNSDEQESLEGGSPSCLKHYMSQAFFTLVQIQSSCKSPQQTLLLTCLITALLFVTSQPDLSDSNIWWDYLYELITII